MKKPDIPDTRGLATPSWVESVRMALRTLMGRQGPRIRKLHETKLSAVADPPTQAEYNALATQVVLLQQKVNELVELLHGE